DATLDALMRARRSGCKLLLVTGETLDELKEFPHLELFDGVVAEDGGVLVWPANGKHKALGPAPPQDFVGYLKDKKVKPLRIGEVMVGTDEPHEKTLRDGIARCRLAYVVHANREQLMALPEGIDKESGLRALLKHLDI